MISSSKCGLVFYHRDHKERREVADLRLICRFFVFSVLFAVECVLHLELLVSDPLVRSGDFSRSVAAETAKAI